MAPSRRRRGGPQVARRRRVFRRWTCIAPLLFLATGCSDIPASPDPGPQPLPQFRLDFTFGKSCQNAPVDAPQSISATLLRSDQNPAQFFMYGRGLGGGTIQLLMVLNGGPDGVTGSLSGTGYAQDDHGRYGSAFGST